jgi:hypothetical protein
MPFFKRKAEMLARIGLELGGPLCAKICAFASGLEHPLLHRMALVREEWRFARVELLKILKTLKSGTAAKPSTISVRNNTNEIHQIKAERPYEGITT